MSSRTNHARLAALQKQMDAAAAEMDFEEAARLRNEIARLTGGGQEASRETDTVTVGQPPPGAMGLGTQVPVRQPPKGWVKPKKPDLGVTNVKPRGGR
jgi:hypothetical protein